MKNLMGTSFIAQLKCIAGTYPPFVALSEGNIAAKSGWLELTHDSSRSVAFRFQFLSQTEDRFHYAITGAEEAGYYADAALGVSLNSYVGLYHLATVENVWKFDFTATGLDEEGFWLRDKDGYRMAVTEIPHAGFVSIPGVAGVPRLNVASGTLARFELTAVRALG